MNEGGTRKNYLIRWKNEKAALGAVDEDWLGRRGS
jgi:hypothetical protein